MIRSDTTARPRGRTFISLIMFASDLAMAAIGAGNAPSWPYLAPWRQHVKGRRLRLSGHESGRSGVSVAEKESRRPEGSGFKSSRHPARVLRKCWRDSLVERALASGILSAGVKWYDQAFLSIIRLTTLLYLKPRLLDFA